MPSVDLLPFLSGDKAWSPEKWGPRHRLTVALWVGGDKQKEIMKKLGASQSFVTNTLSDPRAVYEMEQLAARVADRVVDTSLRIKLYSNEALDEIMEELRTSRNEKVRQTAAFGILDRAGYTAIRDVKEEVAPLLPEEVATRMEEATKEILEYKGNYREVDPKEMETVEVVSAYEADQKELADA